MDFEYQAIDSQGTRHQGTISSKDKSSAQHKLKIDGLHPIKLTKVNNRQGFAGLFTQKVDLEQLEFFTSELSLLVESGVKIDKGIDIIKLSNSHPALTRLLSKISSALKKGATLSDAFKEHETLFGPLYVSLLKIGETSGNLPEVLNRLSEDLKFQKSLRNQISSALTYPAVIFFVCILAIYFVMTFIVPKMAGIFTDLSLAPWYTQAIIKTSNFFIEYEWLVLSGTALSISLLIFALQKQKVKSWFYVKLSSVPVIGKVILTSERIRFAQSMSMMLEAGVQLDTSLSLTTDTLKHTELKRESRQALKQLKTGLQLSHVLKGTRVFPDFFLSIIKVGEETGKLSKVFHEVASRSRTELEDNIKKMTTLLEPIMLLFMGGFVGGIVISMLMSMVAINDVAF